MRNNVGLRLRALARNFREIQAAYGLGRRHAITAFVAVCALLGAGLVVGGGLPASAGNWPGGGGGGGTATITVHAGGDRTGTGTVAQLQGVAFQAVQGATTAGAAAATCTTDATGACTMTVPSGSAYSVSETAAPSGWYRNPTLDEGDSSTVHAAPYTFVTSKLTDGDNVDVPGSTLGSSYYDQGISGQNDGSPWSGLMSASRNDPALSPLCGLRIALILDNSGSMGDSTSGGSTKIADLKTAAKSVISALTGTPTKVAIYSFADSVGSSVPLTALTDSTTEKPLIDKINSLSASGGTNWDQGLYQAVTSSKTYDLAIVLTDGNPTTDNKGVGDGNKTNFHNVDNAIFSANALKALGTRVVTIGIGVSGGDQNISAISGPTASSDYYLATNQNFGDIFKSLATGNCTNALTVQKQVEDPSGNVLTNSTDANGWQFTGALSSGTIGTFDPTATQAGTTGVTQASVSIPSGGTPTVTVTEALKNGYTIDWSKTTCTVDGKTATITKVGDGTANPGVSFTGKANVAMSCTFTNKQPTPTSTLTLVKKDATTGSVLAGAKFTLHKDSVGGATAGTCTTDASGICSVSGLDVGSYYWVETAAPTGYQLPSSVNYGPYQITNANAGGTIATATVQDPQKLTSLTVKKTDESNNPLAGATFALHKDSAGGAVAGTCTTVADGTCSVTGLNFGTYYWVETVAPTGYQLPSPNAAQAVVNAGNAGTSIAATVVKDAVAPTTLTVKKTDESNNPLAGATFELHEGSDGTGTLIYTCTTDSNGACTVSATPANGNVVGFGSYSWVETKAPAGYQLPTPDLFATTVTAANAGGTLTAKVKDPQQLSSLTVKKTDPSGKALAGATFALWQDSNGTPGLQTSGAAPDTSISSCITTPAAGACSVPGLNFGTYYWVETAAPTGYQLSGSGVFGPAVVNAANAGTPIAATVVQDAQQLSTLTVKKTDASADPLGGAIFELHSGSAGGSLAGSCTTDNTTGACSVPNLPFGNYYWVETKAPTGYQLPSPASFGPVVVNAANAGTPIAATEVQDVQQLSTLTVKKVDPSNTPLSGAEFALWRESGNMPGLQQSGAGADTRVSSCTTSGAGGSCAITGLQFGTYYWVETAAPTGYQLSGSGVFGPVVVAAGNAGTSIAATVAVDAEQTTTLTVTKTDDAGKPLAGATFALHRGPDATGTVLYTCTTDATGACAAGSPAGGNVVAFGTYTWEETAAPPNYQLADPTTQTVTINAANAGKANVVSFSDAPTPVATVTKSVGSLAQNADGSWTVTYDLAVRNASTKYATSYTVDDTLGLMNGFTVTGHSVTGPGASASWNGTSDTTVAAKQPIAKDTTVHYTVTVTGTVAAGAIATDGTCTGTPGHGLFNSSTISSAAGSNTDNACAAPVLPTVRKTAGTPVRHLVGGIWDGSWDVSYAITVTNPSADAGLYYSLSDAPSLAGSLDFGSPAVSGTDNAGHAIASGTGDNHVLTSWTGKSPNSEIITKRPLPASATDTYAVTVNVAAKPASLPSGDDLTCAATDTAGRGAFNQATVTSGNDTAGATACASLPQLPAPTVSKTIASTTQNADGTWTIVYHLTVDNSKGASGTFYALTDTPRFGGGITVQSASMTGPNNDTLKVAGWDPLHGQTVAAKDQPLGAGKTDVYTVTVTADVTTGATVTDRDCTLGVAETGTGFLNSATVQSGANFNTDTACSSPSTPTVTKTFVSATQHVSGGAWDGTWDVAYTLKVTDPGSTGLLYTLDDAPAFPAGVSVNRESVVGPNGAANAWTGTGHIAQNQALAAGKTDTYTVTVNATVPSGTSASDRTCQAGTPGKGFYNAATVTSGHDSSTAQACGGIPTPGVPTVTKTVTSSVQNADGTWTITYDLAVNNGSGLYASPYSLSDTLEFGGGINVLTSSVSGPGANPAWTGTAPNTAVAGGGSLAPNSSVHYTVTVTARVTTAATTTDRDCTLDTGETGTGFLNTATVGSSGGSNSGTACASPGTPTVVKKVISAVEGPQWHWLINYGVTVTNGTQNQVSYSLTDTPGFASGMDMSSASVTRQRTAADGTNVGSAAAVAGWTGVAPHAALGDNVTLPAGDTDTYVVTVSAVIDPTIDTALLACSTDGAGHGFFNAATMTSGDDVTRVSACVAGAAHGVGGVSTSKPPSPSPSPSPSHGTGPLATTGSNVVLVGAVGALLVAIGALLVLGTVRRRHH